MKKYILEIVVFFCGDIIMIFEMVGSRIISPYLGNSIYTWTSIIGIILGSLSIGYYFGGVLADKNNKIENLSKIIFYSAIFVFVTLIIKDVLLVFILKNIDSIKISSVIVSLLLFAPASVALGMVSPYAAKIKLEKLDFSGRTVGNLYAISTTGSIFGTFFAGFYLIPQFGTNKILLIISFSLILISISIFLDGFRRMKIFICLLIIFGWMFLNGIAKFSEKNGFIDLDTEYGRVMIAESIDEKTGEKIRNLIMNAGGMSAMFLEKDGLVIEYTKYYKLASQFNKDPRNVLMIGGAGYSYPKEFLKENPNSTIDVVEIDPKITDLARKYFGLKDDKRMNIYHEDGRVYLNRTEKKYDAIFGDAFSSVFSIPHQLATKEAVQKKYDILNEDGVVVLNTISSLSGKSSRFLKAEYNTYKSVFPRVYLFAVENPENEKIVQNVMLVATKSDKEIDMETSNEEIKSFLGKIKKIENSFDTPILTDDYAPVDFYMSENG